MTERDPLHDLLSLATDRVESPGLEHAALRLAHRRLKRRRVVVASVATACVAVAVVGGIQVGRDRSGTLPPVAPTHLTPQKKVWPEWDPAAELPAAADDIAPALPDVIDPPASSPLISEDPIGSAVAVVAAVNDDGVGSVQVLGKGGEWRTVPIDGDYPSAILSPDGSRVSVTYYADSSTGTVIHDLDTGVSRTLPLPDDYEPFESLWAFIDEDRLLLAAGDLSWEVDARSGSAQRLPQGVGSGLSTAIDPTGGIISADYTKSDVLTDYVGGDARQVSMDRTGRLLEVRADADTVVGTSFYEGIFGVYAGPFGVVVADRATLTPQEVLPVRDVDAFYSNGGLSTFALTADGIVLLQVSTNGVGREDFRVVAWDPATGDLSVVSRTEERLSVDFAENQLR